MPAVRRTALLAWRARCLLPWENRTQPVMLMRGLATRTRLEQARKAYVETTPNSLVSSPFAQRNRQMLPWDRRILFFSIPTLGRFWH